MMSYSVGQEVWVHIGRGRPDNKGRVHEVTDQHVLVEMLPPFADERRKTFVEFDPKTGKSGSEWGGPLGVYLDCGPGGGLIRTDPRPPMTESGPWELVEPTRGD